MSMEFWSLGWAGRMLGLVLGLCINAFRLFAHKELLSMLQNVSQSLVVTVYGFAICQQATSSCL